MKRCELCKSKAWIICAADQASLCWGCDAKVHSANFLVARHSRNLLCRVCQRPTPWSAAGANLRPAASACEQCVDGGTSVEKEEHPVVPWSPAAGSCSSVDEAASGGDAVVLGKRFRTDNDSLNTRKMKALHHLSISLLQEDESSSPSLNIIRKKKVLRKLRRTNSGRVDAYGSGDLDSMRRFHRGESGLGRAEFYTFL